MPIFPSRSFMDSSLTFKSLFLINFLHGVREKSSSILLHIAVQFSQHHLLKRVSFPHCILLPPLLQINCPYKCGFIFGLSILFHGSVFLYWYHTVSPNVALQDSLKSESVILSALIFFLKIILPIQGLLCFHTKFIIICSSSIKNRIGILIEIALN